MDKNETMLMILKEQLEEEAQRMAEARATINLIREEIAKLEKPCIEGRGWE